MRTRGINIIGTSAVVLSVVAGCASTPKPAATSAHTRARAISSAAATPGQSTAPVAGTGTPAGSDSSCTTQHLKLSQGRSEGTAGSTYVTYYLRNVGAESCSMNGYPGFALLRADGSIIQHPAKREALPHQPVTLQPGQRASFVVRTLDPSIPGTHCSTTWKTAQVQVYPPNQTAAIRQSSTVAACDLTVRPVSAGKAR